MCDNKTQPLELTEVCVYKRLSILFSGIEFGGTAIDQKLTNEIKRNVFISVKGPKNFLSHSV